MSASSVFAAVTTSISDFSRWRRSTCRASLSGATRSRRGMGSRSTSTSVSTSPFTFPFISSLRRMNLRSGSESMVSGAWAEPGCVASSSAAASMTLPLLSRRTNLRAKTERSAKQMPCALPMVASAGSSTSSLRHTTCPRALKSQMPPLRRSMVMVSSSVRPCRVKTRAPVSDKSVMMPSLATALPSNMLIRTGLAGEKRGKLLHSSCVGTVMATASFGSRESVTVCQSPRSRAAHFLDIEGLGRPVGRVLCTRF